MLYTSVLAGHTFTDSLPEAAYGKCVPSETNFIYGFKLHAIKALDGYISDFILTPLMDFIEPIWDLTATAPFTTA